MQIDLLEGLDDNLKQKLLASNNRYSAPSTTRPMDSLGNNQQDVDTQYSPNPYVKAAQQMGGLGESSANGPDDSFLGAAGRGFANSALATLGDQGKAFSYIAGTDGDIAQKFLDKAQEYGNGKTEENQYTLENRLMPWKDGFQYYTDPNGFTYEIAGLAGSMATLGLESLIPIPGTGFVGRIVGKVAPNAVKSLAGKIIPSTEARNLAERAIIQNAKSKPFEIAANAGGSGDKWLEEHPGDYEGARKATLKEAVAEIPGAIADTALEVRGGLQLLRGGKEGSRYMGAAKSALGNFFEEGYQNRSDKFARDEATFGSVYNPFQWDKDDFDAASVGAMVGIPGFATAAVGSARDARAAKKAQSQQANIVEQPEYTPEETEFQPQEVGSNDLVNKVRALKGQIPFYAEDGTNCMRTMGIALAGTPYEGQTNVDQAVETATELGQLMDPETYIPRPGDLAVNEDGNHIVMVTENGGTIQNGKSANGVYESEASASEMSSDGKVKYYIRTSDYSNGTDAVVSPLESSNDLDYTDELNDFLANTRDMNIKDTEQEAKDRQDAIVREQAELMGEDDDELERLQETVEQYKRATQGQINNVARTRSRQTPSGYIAGLSDDELVKLASNMKGRNVSKSTAHAVRLELARRIDGFANKTNEQKRQATKSADDLLLENQREQARDKREDTLEQSLTKARAEVNRKTANDFAVDRALDALQAENDAQMRANRRTDFATSPFMPSTYDTNPRGTAGFKNLAEAEREATGRVNTATLSPEELARTQDIADNTRGRLKVRDMIDRIRGERAQAKQQALDYEWMAAEHERNTKGVANAEDVRNNPAPNVQKAAQSRAMQDVTQRAMAGDHGAQRTFDRMGKAVKAYLMQREIDRLTNESDFENQLASTPDRATEPFIPAAYEKLRKEGRGGEYEALQRRLAAKKGIKNTISVEENIANGEKALNEIIKTHQDIQVAMYRDDAGNIDFVWGTQGRGNKFKGGYGLAHIIAKRDSENGKGIETARKLIEVIAKGTDVDIQHSSNGDNDQPRMRIRYDGYTAVLSLKTNDGNTWLLTGWEDGQNKKASVSASGEGYDSTTATTAMPTLTRHSGVTNASDNSLSQTEQIGNDSKDKEVAKEVQNNENESKNKQSQVNETRENNNENSEPEQAESKQGQASESGENQTGEVKETQIVNGKDVIGKAKFNAQKTEGRIKNYHYPKDTRVYDTETGDVVFRVDHNNTKYPYTVGYKNYNDNGDVSGFVSRSHATQEEAEKFIEKLSERKIPSNKDSNKAPVSEEERLSPRQKVKEALRELQGKKIHNLDTDTDAILSSTGIKKMVSDKAVNKSKANGYSEKEHLEAASNIKILFENAKLSEEHPDTKNGDSRVTIRRYRCDTTVGEKNKKAVAKITVKLTVENGQRIYSVELEEITKPADTESSGLNSTAGTDNVSQKILETGSPSADTSVTDSIPQSDETDNVESGGKGIEKKPEIAFKWNKGTNDFDTVRFGKITMPDGSVQNVSVRANVNIGRSQYTITVSDDKNNIVYMDLDSYDYDVVKNINHYMSRIGKRINNIAVDEYKSRFEVVSPIKAVPSHGGKLSAKNFINISGNNVVVAMGDGKKAFTDAGIIVLDFNEKKNKNLVSSDSGSLSKLTDASINKIVDGLQRQYDRSELKQFNIVPAIMPGKDYDAILVRNNNDNYVAIKADYVKYFIKEYGNDVTFHSDGKIFSPVLVINGKHEVVGVISPLRKPELPKGLKDFVELKCPIMKDTIDLSKKQSKEVQENYYGFDGKVQSGIQRYDIGDEPYLFSTKQFVEYGVLNDFAVKDTEHIREANDTKTEGFNVGEKGVNYFNYLKENNITPESPIGNSKKADNKNEVGKTKEAGNDTVKKEDTDNTNESKYPSKLYGFDKDMSPMQQAKVLKTLEGKSYNYELPGMDKPVTLTRKEFVETAVRRGLEPKIINFKDGTKEYSLGGYEITKTEYDYAKYLVDNNIATADAKDGKDYKPGEQSPEKTENAESKDIEDAEDEIQGEYKYYLNERGASPGAIPEGFTRFDEDDKGGKYGAIYYAKPLSKNEIAAYELTPDSNNAKQEKIEDFGNKIGGARKDNVSLRIGDIKKSERKKTNSDDTKDLPEWRKPFNVYKDDLTGSLEKPYQVRFKPKAGGKMPWAYRALVSNGYATEQEAETAIKAAVYTQNFTVGQNGTPDNPNFAIEKRIGTDSNRKYFSVKDGFKTREEAQEYAVRHIDEILATKTYYGEADLATPLIKSWQDARTGNAKDRLKGKNATAQMFAEDFGFYGVQFGNWNNQQERQEVMNAAYEGLHDLAEALGLPPKIISLNGNLGLAFGARGQGLSGARAHFEPMHLVINLTKMKGAGALAHEWMHAVDQFLLIKGGIITLNRDAEGKLLDKNALSKASELGFVFGRAKLNKELSDSFKNLMNSMLYKEETFTKDQNLIDKRINYNKEALDQELNRVRKYVSEERRYGSRKAPATAEQLKEFDEIATRIAQSEEEPKYDFGLERYTTPDIEALGALVKKITGRGFAKNNDTAATLVQRIRMGRTLAREKQNALEQSQGVRQVPTDYKAANVSIDSGRATDYWTKPTEMLSRAFSAFVEDELKDKGYTSDFMSYGSDNRLYLFGKPFPEGKERERINENFKAFFKEVAKEVERNQKESDEIKFSLKAEEWGPKEEYPTGERTYGEVLEEVVQAFPNAKVETKNGLLVFSLPNGNKFQVNIKDNIILNAKQQKKAMASHGVSNGYVQGYWRKFSLNSVDRMLGVSKNSERGTAFHEAMHAAIDLALTEKERDALTNYYNKLAEKQGRDVEEVIADAYRDWVLARQKGQGTTFGKLWRKIKDFCTKIKALFDKGAEVQSIFQDIASGSVYERGTEGKGLPDRIKFMPINVKINAATRYPATVDFRDPSFRDLIGDATDTDVARRKIENYILDNLVGEDVSVKSLDGMLNYGFDFDNGTGDTIIHLAEARSGKGSRNSVRRDARNLALSNFEDVLKNSVVVEIKSGSTQHSGYHANAQLDADTKATVRAVMPVIMPSGDAYTLVITAKNFDGILTKDSINVALYEVSTRDIGQKNNATRASVAPVGSVQQNNSAGYSLAEILWDVNDLSYPKGIPYVDHVTGALNFETDPDNMYPEGINFKASIKKEQPRTVTRQELQKAVENIVPLKVEKDYRSDAYRMYNRKANVGFVHAQGSLNELNSILGMYVDSQKKLSENAELRDELLKNAWDYQEDQKKARRFANAEVFEQVKEGAAYFGRLYATDKAQVKAMFPKYYAAFERALNADKALKAKVNSYLETAEAFYKQTPEGRAKAGLTQLEKEPTTWKEKVKTYAKQAYVDWFDDKDVLRRVEREIETITGEKIKTDDSAYMQARVSNSSAASRVDMVVNGAKTKWGKAAPKNSAERKAWHKALNQVYGGAWKHDVCYQDIVDMATAVGEDYLKKGNFKNGMDALGSYLLANRFLEIWETKPDYKASMSKATAKKVVANAPKAIKNAADLYYKFDDNLIAVMNKEGMLSDEGLQGMRKYTRYCPLFRDFADEQAFDKFMSSMSSPNSYINLSNGIKALTEEGSDRTVLDDPTKSMLRMTASILGKVEKNKVGQKFVALSERSNVGQFVIPAVDPKTGKQLDTSNPQFSRFTVWENGEKKAYVTLPEVYDVLENTTHASAYAALLDNMIARGASSTLRKGATISMGFMIRNFIRDTIGATLNSKNGFIPLKDSIRGMSLLLNDVEFRNQYLASGANMAGYFKQDAESLDNMLNEMAGNGWWQKSSLLDKLHMMWEHYEQVGELVEQGTRAGEFKKALEKNKSLLEAAIDAKEVTLDFSRAGAKGRQYNRIIPFFNAVLQGGDKMVRTAIDNPQKTMAMCATLSLATMLLWAINHNDDWYKELDNESKYSNWHFHVGNKHIKIPKPQEFGMLSCASVEAVLEQMFEKNPKAMSDWASQFVETMTPSLLPALYRPILEVCANYDYHFQSAIVGKKYQNLVPEAQINSNTSEFAKLAGKMAGYSPIKIDHLIRGYFGGAGAFVARIPNKILNDGKQPAKYWNEMPVINEFVENDFAHSKSVDNFYELLDAANKQHTTYGKKGSPSADVVNIRKYGTIISGLRKDIQKITANGVISPERKRQLIENKTQRINQVARKAIEKYGAKYL